MTADFDARTARYADLRREGLPAWEAAEAVGVNPLVTGRKYERWFQRIEAGEADLREAART